MAGAQTGVLELPYKAGGAITKFHFVVLNGDEEVVEATANTDRVIGVYQGTVSADDAALGQSYAVQVLGVSWVEFGGSVSQGDFVMAHTDGTAVAHSSTNPKAGIALKDAADGEWAPVLLTPGS